GDLAVGAAGGDEVHDLGLAGGQAEGRAGRLADGADEVGGGEGAGDEIPGGAGVEGVLDDGVLGRGQDEDAGRPAEGLGVVGGRRVEEDDVGTQPFGQGEGRGRVGRVGDDAEFVAGVEEV